MTVDSDEENDFVFEFGNKNDIHVWIGVFEYVSDRMLVLFHIDNVFFRMWPMSLPMSLTSSLSGLMEEMLVESQAINTGNPTLVSQSNDHLWEYSNIFVFVTLKEF